MKFIRRLKKINLTKEEKRVSREFLLSFIDEHPVRNMSDNRHYKHKVTFLYLLFNNKPMFASLIAAILIAFSGGTAIAAENTVPGDLLYPIKVKVNEEVRLALAVSPEAKAAWDAKRAERRLEEVEKLSEKNKLTTSTSQMLAVKFEEFAKKADNRLQKLEDSGKLSDEQLLLLRNNFEVAIKVHSENIGRIKEKEQERTKLKAVFESLRNQTSSTIRDRLEHEWQILKDNTSTTLKVVADNRKNATQNKIAEVERFINNNSDKVSVQNKTESIKRLNEAKVKVAEGDKVYSEGKYGEAIVKYSEAHRQAQEAKLYMTTRFRLENRQSNSTSTFSMASTTVSTTVSTTLKFDDEKKQERFDIRKDLKNLEERLRGEVKQAKENFQDLRKEEMEKVKVEIKLRREKLRETEDKNNSTTTVVVTGTVS